jgi:hypothetical protein
LPPRDSNGADFDPFTLRAYWKSVAVKWPSAVLEHGFVCYIRTKSGVEPAAKASYEAFRNVHMVCSNAGVAGGSGIDAISLDTWR